MAKDKAVLPPSVAAQYEIVGEDWSRCHFFGHFGEIDFNTLSLEAAAALMYGGFPYLKHKTVEVLPIAPLSTDTEKPVFTINFGAKTDAGE